LEGLFPANNGLNARFGDELLNGEIFYSLKEAKIIIEEWRKHYNAKRPHVALGYPINPSITVNISCLADVLRALWRG